MTADELKSMSKGQFVVMKTGTHPMISKLKLYFKWGIRFGEPFLLEDRGARQVGYADRDKLMTAVDKKYPQAAPKPPEPEYVDIPFGDGAPNPLRTEV
jgi:type IV secretion system protein VirD4